MSQSVNYKHGRVDLGGEVGGMKRGANCVTSDINF